ncbi:VOC family protein [Bacteroidales bacterium OttesenSCG-928-K03]|nr:VOC family protein [Odoribacter sp. OttesenSCG-928-L07]MDL2238801.1 VOC family protein [Bacteroidales bacterium OttesenSCG-928-L14]MDL2240782.1 VOC family protein [Bacteroidales bacterium OttesenSCG-928-K22]MDL2242180.1 VOC family protein [Bacteroidales bacterium OttesenSCG-928-K03]
MKEKIISGIQQVGIGIKDLNEAWKWYNDILGFDIKIFDDTGTAEKMLPYTGGKPQDRRAILAYNLRGGGGLEIWQPMGRELIYPKEEIILGDYGIFSCKIKCPDVKLAFETYKNKNVDVINKPSLSPSGIMHFFIKDPYNNIFEIEEDNFVFADEKKTTGGVNGAIIGVSDMEKSIDFYSRILDYDTIVYDITGIFDDLQGVPGSTNKLRRVMIKRSKPIVGPFSQLFGSSHIELVQNLEETSKKIYENRFWGDPGFIHICFDIRNMNKIKEEIQAIGQDFVCDGGRDFDMGDANGHFTYIEDPDGTLIEFVETFKVPIMKKLGIAINLMNRDDKKPLPRYLLKALRFGRVKIDRMT